MGRRPRHASDRLPPFPSAASSFIVSEAPRPNETRNPYTYRGPNAGPNPSQRLHQEFKSLSKEERHRLVEEEAADTDLLARTVHLRFLPTGMLQSELAALCAECGEYLRIRICGNSTNTQNWIYGFVEFADWRAAEEMMRRNGKELGNGAGKPPLRLKCNAAKQPIVDRVFHDADPANKIACIFGSGNFAQRTLKEAVDSYHNLKKKESGMMGRANAMKYQTNAPNHDMTSPSHYTDTVVFESPPSFAPNVKCHLQRSGFPAMDAPSGTTSEEESAGVTPATHLSIVNGGVLEADGVGTPPLLAQGLSLYAPSAPHPSLSPGSDAFSFDGRQPSPVSGSLSHLRLAPPLTQPAPGLHFGSDVLERCQNLLLSAMGFAKHYIATQQDLYRAIGSVQMVLRLLEEHLPPPACAESGLFGTEKADVPQRVLQLRLLAHLLLALLGAMKEDRDAMVASLHEVVRHFHRMPTARLLPPLSAVSIGAVSSRRTRPETDAFPPHAAPTRVGAEEDTCNPLFPSFDFLGGFTFAGAGEEGEAHAVHAAMGILPPDDLDDAEENARQEAMHQRDVRFYAFALNVLLTIGLATEELQPVVSHCVYVCARERAEKVLGMRVAALDHVSASEGSPKLCPVWFPALPTSRDPCAFVKAFFNSFSAESIALGETFWDAMPPLHLVRCFPVPNVTHSEE